MPAKEYLDAGGLNRYHADLMNSIAQIGGGVENVAPFFSVPVSSMAWKTSGGDTTYDPTAGYWHSIPSVESDNVIVRLTDAPDNAPTPSGWARLVMTNDSTNPYSVVVAPGRDTALPTDTTYTLMLEWAYMKYWDLTTNATTTGSVNVSIVGGDGKQIIASTSTGTISDASGVMYLTVKTRASYGMDDYGTMTPNFDALLGLQLTVPANTRAAGQIRVSMYKGTYSGSYVAPKPWAFFAGLRGVNLVPGTVTLDRLSADVQTAIRSISNLTNGDTTTY